jgi:lipoprotein-anchoring transpeptidase ErfK/SrfK
MSRQATVAAVAALVALACAAGVTIARHVRHVPLRQEPPGAVTELPAPSRGGLPVGRALPLAGTHRSLWVAARASTAARAHPSTSARRVGTVTARTPENTTNILLPLGRHRDAAGRLWVRVRLAALPNGRTGWVPRSALGAYGTVRTRLVVDRHTLTATLLRDGRAVLRAPVGIGTTNAPTPAGTFVVRDILRRYRSAFYGPVAFGTSARSATLTDWPGGGYVGIHGTDRPELLPGRVSHGCIRMRNRDVARLARPMPTGTPLTIL